MLNQLIKDLQSLKNPAKAKVLQGFFKTGKGEYGEGDIFLGITVPDQRKLANKYLDLNFAEIQELLESNIHEYRLTAVIILTLKYKKADFNLKKEIFDFYISNTRNINNWDLVDVTCPCIVGNFLLDKDRKILYKLVKSSLLWDKRIAIISTFEFIKNNDFEDALKISEILITDKNDLIQKAVGWMLREIGKRNKMIEIEFLEKYYKIMPRTMLRYSIEKFSEEEKKKYMGK
ncbi:MAG: DNA alkylation repair protein [Candidatus Gracilibacteria bacterium]|nr:DNA alkylation repair protein [Candidatus Gracilibacteria bacterium]